MLNHANSEKVQAYISFTLSIVTKSMTLDDLEVQASRSSKVIDLVSIERVYATSYVLACRALKIVDNTLRRNVRQLKRTYVTDGKTDGQRDRITIALRFD